MTHWNYRIVDMASEENSEPFFEIREVFYNEQGHPCGHTAARVCGEHLGELDETIERFDRCMDLPVLLDKDFTGKFNEESFH